MNDETTGLLSRLTRDFHRVLGTYANVHRGSGHASRLTTELYDEARRELLRHLGRSEKSHGVVFASPRTAERIEKVLAGRPYQTFRSKDVGLRLGVHAVVARLRDFPRTVPFLTGGGTARLVSRTWIIPNKGVAHLEPGTPAVLNALFFVLALKALKASGRERFEAADASPEEGKSGFFPGLSGKELLEKVREAVLVPDAPVPAGRSSLPYLHFDHAASTPTLEPVWRAFRERLVTREEEADSVLHEARRRCARFFGAPLENYRIEFIANTTEGLNRVAEALAGREEPGGITVVNSLIEHNSNDLTWRQIPGARVTRLSFGADGTVEPADLEKALSESDGGRGADGMKLVALTGASNVLGGAQDLEALSEIAHRHGAKILVDAAQLAPHRPVSMEASGLDLLVASAHKLYAPFGSGVLITRKGVLKEAALGSSGSEVKAENIAGIAAFSEALSLLDRVGMETVAAEERACTERLLKGLRRIPDLRVYGSAEGAGTDRLGVVSFNLGNRMSHAVGRMLAEGYGIGTRTGCHCAHIGIKEILGVKGGLERFQRIVVSLFPKVELPGVARVSLGIRTTPAQVDRLLEALAEIASGRAKADPSARKRMEAWTRGEVRACFG